MTSRVEQRAITPLAVGCFVQVAKLNRLQNKWITIDAWLQFSKDTSDISGKLIENSTFNNEFGYYLMSKRLKLDGMKTQRRVSCILITKS